MITWQLQWQVLVFNDMIMIWFCMLWIVFLIILLCIWSFIFHYTNSYLEETVIFYFYKHWQFHFMIYDHSSLDIELCDWFHVIQHLLDSPATLISYQPITSMLFLWILVLYQCVTYPILDYCKLCDAFYSFFDFIPELYNMYKQSY